MSLLLDASREAVDRRSMRLPEGWQPQMTKAGLVFLALLVPMGVAWFFDPRLLADISIWAKPMKFAFSIAIYLLTLGFFWQFIAPEKRATRLMQFLVVTVIAALAIEQFFITLQAARGMRSHFNETTVFYTALYRAMGVLAVYFTVMTGVVGWHLWRNPRADLSPTMRAGIATSLMLTVPLTVVTAGFMGGNGSHLVGATSDAGGLWLLGWSRIAGDLRAPHFFATHTMQIVPLASVLLGTVFGWQRRWPILGFAALYAAFTAWAFAEAILGRPFLAFLG